MMSCAEMAARLNWAAVRAKAEIDIPTEAVVSAAEEKAKAAIGTYSLGWPQLAESTQADRAAKGYSPNDPLLRTGAMRDGIAHKAELSAEGAEGVVFSDDVKALWAELGTSRGEPPRSFLYQSLLRCDAEIESAFTAFLESLFA
jgi:hypothetical protein